MKRNIHIATLFLISLIFSCSNDNSAETIKEEFREFSVAVDGKATSFDDDFSTYFASPYYPSNALRASIYNGSKLVIKALDSVTHQSVTLTIGNAFSNELLKEGTYQIGTPKGDYPITNIYYDNDDILGNNNEHYFNKNYGCHLTGNQVVGEVVISEIDKENKRVKGFFKGNLFGWVFNSDRTEYNSFNVNLNNGRFDLPYNSEDNFQRDSDIDKGEFAVKITHEDRDFTFLPTDGVVTGVGTRHFRVQLKMNEEGNPKEFNMRVENENLGVVKIKVENTNEISIGRTYDFNTDLSLNFLTIKHYIYFFDFYYNSSHTSSPLPTEKNDFKFTIISINKEEKIIEGKFSVDNSIREVIMTGGYFKVKYDELK